MKTGFIRTALILGLLSTIGPFAIDMYLPGLPAIGRELHASTVQVQLSLVAFIVAAGLSQLVYGPASDILGRKLPICFGLTVFALASACCAFASRIETLVALRMLQGIGACATMVLTRAIVRDLYNGQEAVRMMGLLILVFSISPILAPLVGSLVVAATGWRTIFVLVATAAVLGLLLVLLLLKESRSTAARRSSSWHHILGNYSGLIRDTHFLGLSALSGFSFGAFMIYLANSSFILIGHYGLTPTQYSLCFSLNAIAFVAMAQVNGWLVAHFSLIRVVKTAVFGVTLSMLTLLMLVIAGVDDLRVIAGVLFIGYGFLGPIMPNAMVLGLEHYGRIAGTASALFGTVHMLISAGVMGISGLFANGTLLPMVAAIAATTVCAFVVTFILLPVRPAPQASDAA